MRVAALFAIGCMRGALASNDVFVTGLEGCLQSSDAHVPAAALFAIRCIGRALASNDVFVTGLERCLQSNVAMCG